MATSNAEVSKALETIATLLELENANQFRIRAYRNAARIVDTLPQPVSDLIAKEVDLSEYGGIGKDLAGKIKDYIETGHIPLLDELSSHHPPGILALTRLQNLGPKRIKSLNDQLHISSLEDLKKACEKQQIRELRGFGEKTEKKLLEEAMAVLKSGEEKRILWAHARQIALNLINWLRASKAADKIEMAGSFRRRKETVGDLDILVTSKRPKELIDHFISYENKKEILSQGKTRSSLILKSGIRIDLRVLKEESFGSGLYYFTGSKAHNIEIRRIARSRGLKINEYGVYKGSRKIAGKTEREIFDVLGIDYIPPELRENSGEIAAAMEHRIPRLIKDGDLKGDLHSHTTASDGKNSIMEMALAAREQGLKYLAITDHSKNIALLGGLDERRLRKQMEEIDQINAKIKGIKILKGIEVDILEDGSLDLPDSVLKELDITVCSIHTRFKMSKSAMTKRILRAMDNRYFNILGHPTGRLILKRRAYEFDVETIIKKAVETHKIFEINSQPDRLDLDADHCQLAKDLGAKFAINTDAHSVSELNFRGFGIAQARRGWLEKKNVINTQEWPELKKLLKMSR